MSDVTNAIAIMDEKGRRMYGPEGKPGKTMGLWQEQWDYLRSLLLAIKLRAERDKAIIEKLHKECRIYQQVDTIESGAVVTGVKIDKL